MPSGEGAPAGAARSGSAKPELTTSRVRAKADRRASLLAQAARLFAQRGFDGVSLEDLGAAAGVRGPAVYRHFPSKQGVLAALLVEVSEHLRDGGAAVVAGAPNADAALRSLVRFHVAFALSNPDVIRVQDRDLESLAEEDRRSVRAAQRAYVELWVATLAELWPGADLAELRLRAQATFGLLNSTPHSVRGLPQDRVAPVLEEMALAALRHARR